MPIDLDDVYSKIGEVLDDSEIVLLVKQATGKDIYNEWATPNDPRKIRIKKTVEALKLLGDERWLMTYILIYLAARQKLRQTQEKLREVVVTAFPTTLMNLPQAEIQVDKALIYLRTVLNVPFPPPLKVQLRPKRGSFAAVAQNIMTLVGYKELQELLLLLLFALNYNEALAANPLGPNLESIVRGIDNVVQRAPAALTLLGPAASTYAGLVGSLAPQSATLQTAAGTPAGTAAIIDGLQRSVRLYLAQVNKDIFQLVYELSFEPGGPLAGALLGDVPTDIESRDGFKDLVHIIRDLTVTLLARTLKYKFWQDVENQLSLVGSYFEVPGDAAGIAEDWFSLTAKINWLAELEPDQSWSLEAKKLSGEIDNEMYKEGNLDEEVKAHFDAYRKWFGGPLRKIDEALKQDCGSLRKMDDPLNKILNELR